MAFQSVWDRKKPSFGFISTRFAGLDGVSLETEKWVDVLRSKGSAVYFKKTVVVNRYAIFTADIEPKGFDVVAFDGCITDARVDEIRSLLQTPRQVDRMVENNYMLGWRYLSYEMLEEKLEQLLINFYGA